MSAGLSENNSNWDKKLSDKVSGPDVPMEDWNTPSEQLWDRIESGLPEKRRRRGAWIWFFGAISALVVLASVYLISSDNQILNRVDSGELTEQPTENRPENDLDVSEKKSAPDEIKESVTSSASIDKSADASGKELSSSNEINGISPNIITENNVRFDNSDQTSSEKLKSPTLIESRGNDGSVDKFHGEKYSAENKEIGSTQSPSVDQSLNTRELNTLSNLPGITPVVSLNRGIDIDQIPLTNEIEIVSKKGSFLLGINFAMFGDFAQLNDEYASVVEPFNFRKASLPGFEGGVSFGYKFNEKWSLLSGLQYRNIRIQSGHNATLAYDPANEIYDGHSYYITYNMNYATSYGVLPAEMAIARANDDVQEETQVGVEIDMVQSISLLSVPLLLRRSIYTNNKGNWSLGLAAGPSVSFPIANSTDIDHTYSTHEDMHVYHADIKDELKDLNLVLFNAEIELMNSFYFGRKGSLIIAPFFRYGFTPLYENNQLSSSSNEFGIRAYYLFEL